MSDRVSVHIEDGIADVRLNRPEKMNAIDPAMFNALCDTGEALAKERSVRAVVLSGEGRAFCAGLAMSGEGDRELPAANNVFASPEGPGTAAEKPVRNREKSPISTLPFPSMSVPTPLSQVSEKSVRKMLKSAMLQIRFWS